MAFDNFRHNISFHSLCDIIQREGSLDESSRVYVKWAKEFFNEITKSLDSMLNPREKGGYYFMEPSLKKILEIYGKDTSKISGGEIAEIRQNFGMVLTKLENLETDASNFYKSGDSEYTFNFLKKLLPRNGGFSEYSKRITDSDLEGDD